MKKATKPLLNPVAKKWVKALRSGKYKQGRGHLATGEKYCCLGVLCDLAVKAGVIRSFRGNDGKLPIPVARWAKLQDDMGLYQSSPVRRCRDLAEDNDSGKTFLTIAKTIESQPEGLFRK